MNGKQYKHLIVAVVSAIILLVIAIAMLVYIAYKPKDIVNHYYNGKDGKDGKSIIGPQGPPGETVVGPQGIPGTNAETIIKTETITNTVNVPVPGPKGDAGDPQPQLKVKVDPVTCVLSSMYEGDDAWQTLAQLPKPCEVGNG